MRPALVCVLAACRGNGALRLVKSLLHRVTIAALVDGALYQSRMVIAICVSKGPTAVNLACPLHNNVNYAKQERMVQVWVPTRVMAAAPVQLASG